MVVSAVPFDTLKPADRMEAGGFTSEQARAAAALPEITVGAGGVGCDSTSE
jgi:hypothetical protein